MGGEDIKTGMNIALLLLALAASLYLATRFGFIHCSMLPHWCGVYTKINEALYGRAYPSILVLYGDEGMGDPNFVADYIRKTCRYHVWTRRIDTVGPGNLENYDVVIVEHARYMTASQLEMLWDFVAKGGKLVFIGDSGVEGPEEEYLTWEDLGEENREGIVNVWDRKKEDGTVIDFGTSVLGLRYLTNIGEENAFSGEVLVEPDILTEGLPKRVDLDTTFAATQLLGDTVFGSPKVVASIVNVEGVEGAKPPYPAVIRTGYRVFYLAYPPELAGKHHLLILFNLCRVVT